MVLGIIVPKAPLTQRKFSRKGMSQVTFKTLSEYLSLVEQNVSGYVCNHSSLKRDRDAASTTLSESLCVIASEARVN